MPAGEPSPTVVIFDGGVQVATGRLDGLGGLEVVDRLARLCLAAGRLGCSVVVRDPSAELCELLELVGLAGVIEVSGSALQAGGEPEGGEELGVQEVLPGGDPPA